MSIDVEALPPLPYEGRDDLTIGEVNFRGGAEAYRDAILARLVPAEDEGRDPAMDYERRDAMLAVVAKHYPAEDEASRGAASKPAMPSPPPRSP